MSTVGIFLQVGGGILALIALVLGFSYICDDVEQWIDELNSN